MVKFVLCDADSLLRPMVEAILERLGHDIIGVADHTAMGTQLVRHGHPDAVIVDLSLGYNTDFDVIDEANAAGAKVLVFSHNQDHRLLDRYRPRPVVVPKPDLVALETAISRLGQGDDDGPALKERRQRPVRTAIGPTPSGFGDAGAFYEALGNAAAGDALLSLEPAGDSPRGFAGINATLVLGTVRATDRVLAADSSAKVFLAGGGFAGVESFVRRVRSLAPDLAEKVAVRSIVVEPDEDAAAAFARLRTAGQLHQL